MQGRGAPEGVAEAALEACQIFGMDATGVLIGERTGKVYVSIGQDHLRGKKRVVNSQSGGSLDVMTKVYLNWNAEGHVCPPVVVIAD
jgi:hypothetical protein